MNRQTDNFFELVKRGNAQEIKAASASQNDINQYDKSGLTAAMWAVTMPTDEILRLLILAGARLDVLAKDGRSAMEIWAHRASNSSASVLAAMIEAGVNINSQNVEGRTPLMYAVRYNGKADVIKSLLSGGADVNHRDSKGCTSLLLAAAYDPPRDYDNQVIRLLLEAGARVNEQDNAGMTALMWAAKRNREAAKIALLLEAGANATLRTTSGKTAYILAHHNPKLKDPAYHLLRKLCIPDPGPNLESVRKADRRLRVVLLLFCLSVNLVLGILLVDLGFSIDNDTALNILWIAIALGLNANPIRLVILIAVYRAKEKQSENVISSRTPPHITCWKQVLWQTVVITSFAALGAINLLFWSRLSEIIRYLVVAAELGAIAWLASRMKRTLNAIIEIVDRATSW